MNRILRYALRELGPAALLRFGQYRLGLASGWIRLRTPLYEWEDRPLSSWLNSSINADPAAYRAYRISMAPRFFVPELDELRVKLEEILSGHMEIAILTADRIGEGSFQLFGLNQAELGFPPDWHRFAMPQGDHARHSDVPDSHWSEIDLQELPADVKLIWEINRFGWVFPLARAYALTGDTRYFENFWTLFESWRVQNPPNLGLNWHSAQEVSVRMLALIFAFYVMRPEFEDHPDRVVDMAQTIAVHAHRIPPTVPYAIAQGNNHLLVEAAALYSVGALFPEFKEAGRWKRIGSRWLIRALRTQVFLDGGYVQHSVNYHRMALQIALWAARVAELQGEPLPHSSLKRIRLMTTWLQALVDPSSGGAPNFGPNDGAEVLPLSMLPFDDHRPTIQAATRLLGDGPRYSQGAWDEWSLWLGVLQDAGTSSIVPAGAEIDTLQHSGLYLLNGASARGILRAGHFGTRPGHADQLHFDLWFGEFNIALDAGTYLYNADAPWDNAFSGAKHHNTVLVDGSDAMIRAGRFLWLNWNQAAVLGRWRSEQGDVEALIAERPGDLAGEVIHRRTVIRAGDRKWIIIDDLLGASRHTIALNWMLPDLDWKADGDRVLLDSPVGEVRLAIEPGNSLLRIYRSGACIYGQNSTGRSETLGWFSPTYAYKLPALQLIHQWETILPLRIKTLWTWSGADENEVAITWNLPGDSILPVQRVGYGNQSLEINDAHSVDTSGFRNSR